MSGLLLDTNALLWVLSDSPRLGAEARELIRTSARVHFSPVSVVEIEIKVLLGRLQVPGDVAAAGSALGLVELPLTSSHAQGLAVFPELARHDPFDRMLLGQATAESMTLLTSDQVLLDLGRPDVRSARE